MLNAWIFMVQGLGHRQELIMQLPGTGSLFVFPLKQSSRYMAEGTRVHVTRCLRMLPASH